MQPRNLHVFHQCEPSEILSEQLLSFEMFVVHIRLVSQSCDEDCADKTEALACPLKLFGSRGSRIVESLRLGPKPELKSHIYTSAVSPGTRNLHTPPERWLAGVVLLQLMRYSAFRVYQIGMNKRLHMQKTCRIV